jgi:hypothetical protein
VKIRTTKNAVLSEHTSNETSGSKHFPKLTAQSVVYEAMILWSYVEGRN